MNAKINKDGQLTIRAENELESYALSKWYADNDIDKLNMIISWDNANYLSNHISREMDKELPECECKSSSWNQDAGCYVCDNCGGKIWPTSGRK